MYLDHSFLAISVASVEQNTIVESLVVMNWFSHVTPKSHSIRSLIVIGEFWSWMTTCISSSKAISDQLRHLKVETICDIGGVGESFRKGQ